MELVTKGCSAHGHREFVVEVGDLPGGDTIVGWLEESVASGTRFLPGQTVQIGWMWVQVGEAGGRLTLHEPDMKSIPIAWVPGIRTTLLHLLRQRFVADSLKLPYQPSSIMLSAIVCSRYASAREWDIERAEQSGTDSGWLVACTDSGHDHRGPEVQLVSLYELAVNAPAVVEYLGLPAGTRAMVSPSGLEAALYEGTEVTVQPGSYLDAKRRSAPS